MDEVFGREVRSGSQQTFDGPGCFVDEFGRAGAVTRRCGTCDTVLEVLVEQPNTDTLEALADRSELREDVDAIGVVLDQPLEPAHLPFDPLEPKDQLLLVTVVSGLHDATIPIGGMGMQHRPAQGRCVKVGLRLSRNAAMPSWASAVMHDEAISSIAYEYALSWSRSTWA